MKRLITRTNMSIEMRFGGDNYNLRKGYVLNVSEEKKINVNFICLIILRLTNFSEA